jgi:hypothetical protein
MAQRTRRLRSRPVCGMVRPAPVTRTRAAFSRRLGPSRPACDPQVPWMVIRRTIVLPVFPDDPGLGCRRRRVPSSPGPHAPASRSGRIARVCRTRGAPGLARFGRRARPPQPAVFPWETKGHGATPPGIDASDRVSRQRLPFRLAHPGPDRVSRPRVSQRRGQPNMPPPRQERPVSGRPAPRSGVSELQYL